MNAIPAAVESAISRVEVVAKAIWDAQDKSDGEGEETPSWYQLSDHKDAKLKAEIRLMAEAAIKASDESRTRVRMIEGSENLLPQARDA